MNYNINDEIYTFDNFGKTSPRVSYSRKLKKIVLENYEAFWLLLHSTKHPDIINGVSFETDNEFKSYYINTTGDKGLDNLKINKFILKEMLEALNVSDQRDNFEGSVQDKSERLYITDSSDHENLSDMKIVQSKSSSQKKTKWDAKTKSESYNEDRMNLEDYKKWSDEEMRERQGGGDGEV